jgi:hypothetical protein
MDIAIETAVAAAALAVAVEVAARMRVAPAIEMAPTVGRGRVLQTHAMNLAMAYPECVRLLVELELANFGCLVCRRQKTPQVLHDT